ncbi:MAG: family 16 glycosylhydrolase, partial [Pseudonocardia sp.]|nr:family 16 glycosylhydrolase [Pseudonocardia sp.]
EDEPSDEEPADGEPVGEEPSGGEPSSEPSGDEPAGDEPAGEEPFGEEPAGEEPSGEEPAGEEPSGEEPGDEPSGEERSADEPADEAPADEPAADVPADDAPAAPALDACGAPDATAASAFGWGTPARDDEFDDALDTAAWQVYEGTGFDGQGTRTADALSVEDGILSITGDAESATGGMSWQPGQMYGRWEARVRASAADESYNALLLLWPDDESGAGSEIDFMEMLDPTRQTTSAFVHHGADDAQVTGEVAVDGTRWHNWAVEWTPSAVTTYVDGVEWWRVDDPALLPEGPMHLCVQLDWFPIGDEEVQPSSMQVDWVRQYALDPEQAEPADGPPAEEPADTAPAEDPADGPADETDGGGDEMSGDEKSGSEGAAAPASPARLSEGAPDAARPGLVERAVPAASQG